MFYVLSEFSKIDIIVYIEREIDKLNVKHNLQVLYVISVMLKLIIF